jgi:uncharacterized membrane protein YciS (DUF1049 family)
MGTALKVLIGLILIIIGLGLFVDSVRPVVNPIFGGSGQFLGVDWLGNFLIVLTGVIPPFLILVGLFVVWLEIDELKAERELKREEEEEKKETKKKKKK